MTARPFLCIAWAGVLCNTYREAMDGRLFCFVSCVMLSLGERPGAPKGRPRPAPAPTPWFCEASGEAADREPASLCHSRRETRSVGTGAVEQQLRAKHVSFAASINPERIANQKPNVIVPRPRGCPPKHWFCRYFNRDRNRASTFCRCFNRDRNRDRNRDHSDRRHFSQSP